MVDGFEAFKICLAIKLHFTQEKYNVFQNNGAVNTKLESFNNRNDKYLYIKMGNKFTDKRHLAHCVAANVAYGNSQPVYDLEKAIYNYNVWRKRKDAIHKFFQDDIDKLHSINAEEIFITSMCVETKSILQNKINFLENIKSNPLTSSKILIVKKLHGFIKYDSLKIDNILESKFENNYIIVRDKNLSL